MSDHIRHRDPPSPLHGPCSSCHAETAHAWSDARGVHGLPPTQSQRAHGYVDPSVEHDWTAGHSRHSDPMRTSEPGVASAKTHDSVTNDPDPTWTLDTVRPPSLCPSGHPQCSS